MVQPSERVMACVCVGGECLRVPLQHLGGAVLQGTTEGGEEFPGTQHGGRAKVYEPDVEAGVDDDVLILDVTVQDGFVPQVGHSCHQLTTSGRDRHTEKREMFL